MIFPLKSELAVLRGLDRFKKLFKSIIDETFGETSVSIFKNTLTITTSTDRRILIVVYSNTFDLALYFKHKGPIYLIDTMDIDDERITKFKSHVFKMFTDGDYGVDISNKSSGCVVETVIENNGDYVRLLHSENR